MTMLISRTYGASETKGSIYILNGEQLVFRCKCLELPNNGNQKNVSCIPEGVYEVIKTYTEKRGNHFRVLNVPGRTDILIHRGNYTHDTLGCILPGIFFTDLDYNGQIDIGDSTHAMEKLYEILPDKFKLIII